MSEEDYFREIEEIRKVISEDKIQEAEERLEKLYAYKPVRILWFLAKAEIVNKKSGPKEAWKVLEDKYNYGLYYPGIEKVKDFHLEFNRRINDLQEVRRLTRIYKSVLGECDKRNEELNEIYEKYSASEDNFVLEELMWAYFRENQIVVQQIIRIALVNDGFLKHENRDCWFYHEKNFDYLEERMFSKNEYFILLADGTNEAECDVIALMLQSMGNKVLLLTAPYIVDKVLSAEDSVMYSITNKEIFEDAVVFPVVQYRNLDGVWENNREDLILWLCEHETERNYAILLATGNMFLELMKKPKFQKHIECLTTIERNYAADKMYFGWVGDYCSYISDIYTFDAEAELNAASECDFSIIIPVRNSSTTLEYTLRTCLDQDYCGSYEIIVSDNSTEGNYQVYDLCKALNDSRIKYFKTPRNLPLNRSFEYAFLKSRGEFVFSFGADDGICPFALTVLADVRKQYPDEPVIQWERGYYSWKDFGDGTEGKLVIPREYKTGNYGVHYISRVDYFARALKYTNSIYILPLLYINSGCKRSYLKTLLKKTGRLWDGSNQDIYMGVMNAAINDKILNLKYPLTIAGASNNSIGFVNVICRERTKEELELMKSSYLGDNVGNYAVNGIVLDVPIGTGDTYSLYINLCRAIQLGVLPELWLSNLFDYKKIYSDNFKEHPCTDTFYDKYIHYARALAVKRGEAFLNWFDEQIYIPGMQPKLYVYASKREKPFKEGRNEDGSLILDSLKYGVDNIEKAVKLFAEICWGFS